MLLLLLVVVAELTCVVTLSYLSVGCSLLDMVCFVVVVHVVVLEVGVVVVVVVEEVVVGFGSVVVVVCCLVICGSLLLVGLEKSVLLEDFCLLVSCYIVVAFLLELLCSVVVVVRSG